MTFITGMIGTALKSALPMLIKPLVSLILGRKTGEKAANAVANFTFPWKWLITIGSVLVILGTAFFMTYSAGKESVQKRWDESNLQEKLRQTEINNRHIQQAYRTAGLLKDKAQQRLKLIEELTDEAYNAPNATDQCLDPDSVLRLNQIK